MTKLLNIVKAATLLSAMAILAVSSLPNQARAQLNQDPIQCEGSGHDCHVEQPDGTVGHYKQI